MDISDVEKYRLKKALQYGAQTPSEEELITYILFAELFGWSPRDIEHLEWSKVIKLRELALQMQKMKKEEISRRDMKRLTGNWW